MAIRPITTGVGSGEPYEGITGSYYDTTKFVPELYSKKVLRNFYLNTFYQQIMNTDLNF